MRCFYKNLVSFRRLVAILLGGLVLGVAGLIVAGRRIWPSAELAMQPYDEGAGGGNGHAVPEDFLVVDGKEGNHHRRNKNEKKSSKTFVARKRPRRTSKRKTSGTKNRSSSRSANVHQQQEEEEEEEEVPAEYVAAHWQQRSSRHAKLLAVCDNAPSPREISGELLKNVVAAATTQATEAASGSSSSGDDGERDNSKEAWKEARLAAKSTEAEKSRQEYCATHDVARNCSLSRRVKWLSRAPRERVRAPIFIKTHKVGGTTFGSLLQTVAGQVGGWVDEWCVCSCIDAAWSSFCC